MSIHTTARRLVQLLQEVLAGGRRPAGTPEIWVPDVVVRADDMPVARGAPPLPVDDNILFEVLNAASTSYRIQLSELVQSQLCLVVIRLVWAIQPAHAMALPITIGTYEMGEAKVQVSYAPHRFTFLVNDVHTELGDLFHGQPAALAGFVEWLIIALSNATYLAFLAEGQGSESLRCAAFRLHEFAERFGIQATAYPPDRFDPDILHIEHALAWREAI